MSLMNGDNRAVVDAASVKAAFNALNASIFLIDDIVHIKGVNPLNDEILRIVDSDGLTVMSFLKTYREIRFSASPSDRFLSVSAENGFWMDYDGLSYIVYGTGMGNGDYGYMWIDNGDGVPASTVFGLESDKPGISLFNGRLYDSGIVFKAHGSLGIGLQSTLPIHLISDSGLLDHGLSFGSGLDVNLWRLEANSLKTDSIFTSPHLRVNHLDSWRSGDWFPALGLRGLEVGGDMGVMSIGQGLGFSAQMQANDWQYYGFADYKLTYTNANTITGLLFLGGSFVGNNIFRVDAITTFDSTLATVKVSLEGDAYTSLIIKGKASGLYPAGYDLFQAYYANTLMVNIMTTGALVVKQKTMITPEGGIARRFINKTGGASVKGTAVRVYNGSAINEAVDITPADAYDAIGFIYESGIADGQPVWVVTGGIGEALLKDGTSAALRDWIRTSTDTPGRVISVPVFPPVLASEHFSEVGHALEAKGPGVDVLVKIAIHLL